MALSIILPITRDLSDSEFKTDYLKNYEVIGGGQGEIRKNPTR